MQLDFDSLSVVASNLIIVLETFITWLNVRLMNVGLDSTTILVRGPSLVLMGLAFSAARYSVRRMLGFGAEQAKSLWVLPASGSGYRRQPA